MGDFEGIVIDYERQVNYIEEQTGLSREIIEKVMDSETQYLIDMGVVEEI